MFPWKLLYLDCYNSLDLSVFHTHITPRRSNIPLITFHSPFFCPFRRRPTIMCLWRHRLRGPCPARLCCWGPWGLGCVATAPGSWPSTTGPLHVCCSWLAHTLMPAWWAQQLTGPLSWMLLAGPAPTRRSHLPPLWARKFPRNNQWSDQKY